MTDSTPAAATPEARHTRTALGRQVMPLDGSVMIGFSAKVRD